MTPSSQRPKFQFPLANHATTPTKRQPTPPQPKQQQQLLKPPTTTSPTTQKHSHNGSSFFRRPPSHNPNHHDNHHSPHPTHPWSNKQPELPKRPKTSTSPRNHRDPIRLPTASNCPGDNRTPFKYYPFNGYQSSRSTYG